LSSASATIRSSMVSGSIPSSSIHCWIGASTPRISAARAWSPSTSHCSGYEPGGQAVPTSALIVSWRMSTTTSSTASASITSPRCS
jgi:hypothetical protein